MEHGNKNPEWYSKNVPPDHHHPMNDWLVDRCADRCDDQLPLFSRVGRGLRGDGYKVTCRDESSCETYLEGWIYDAATGTYSSDPEWTSENVNGGHLSYIYHVHPYGEPPTFTITFNYERPNTNDEWTWTTPAIPYVLDPNLSGIGSLFIKPTTGATWAAVKTAVQNSDLPKSVAETLAAYEKLIYPTDETRAELHPPLPTDPWTVNLTYGKGGDIDCPTTAEAAADDTATLDAAKQYTRTHLHEDLYGAGVSGHDYTSTITALDLLPLMGDTNGQATVWDWIKYAKSHPDLHEGPGIEITPGDDGLTISTKLLAGPGIQIEYEDDPESVNYGAAVISTTDKNGNWRTLNPGVDYTFELHNGWYIGNWQNDNTAPQRPKPAQSNPPSINIIPSYDLAGNIIGAQVRMNLSYSRRDNQQQLVYDHMLVNADDLMLGKNAGETPKFKLGHQYNLVECPEAAIFSIKFLGDYAVLNSKGIKAQGSPSTNIWNVQGTNSSDWNNPAGTPDWHNCGACWGVNTTVVKYTAEYGTAISSNLDAGFILRAANIADGYNNQYWMPPYGYDHLCVRSQANLTYDVTLG